MTAFKQYGAEATDSEVVRETELLFVKSTFNIAESNGMKSIPLSKKE